MPAASRVAKQVLFSFRYPTGTASHTVAGIMQEPGTEPNWLPVAGAARALGVTEHAIRRRIKRGTLEVRRETVGNRVRTLVAVPVENEGGNEDQNPVVNAEVRAAVAEALVVELRGELAEVKKREQRLLALIERLTTEQHPWPGLRTWWRRLWSGEAQTTTLGHRHETEQEGT